jgi:hypothetical protein
MKLIERVGAAVTFIGLWILLALLAGIAFRPVYEAFLLGFRIWGE